MGAGLLSQFVFMAIPEENKPTSLCSWKCTPFGAAHHFPRRGKFALRSALGLISTSRHSTARISPSGGDVAIGDRRGAFPTRHRRGCMVCHRAKPGCKGFRPRSGHYNCARRAPPQPFEPFEPSEPFEPGPRNGPIMKGSKSYAV